MIRIALCQLNPKAGKPRKNFATIEQVVRKYSKQKIKLFIFPEDFLNGVLRGRQDILLAGKKFDFWLNKFCALAKRYKIDLIPGSLPSIENSGLYNTTVYINSAGKILNKYFKTNLWLAEREDYSINPYKPKAFDSVLGKTMQIICFDVMDRRIFEEAIKQNVKWIINTSLWCLDQSKALAKKRGLPSKQYNIAIRKSERLNALIETRSHEYNMGMIFCNIGGNHRYLESDCYQEVKRSAGCTQIIAPLDGIRKRVRNRKEQILICDIPAIKDYISDHEILYGRRKDIKTNYPYSKLHDTSIL
ncbi:MAG: carbon-nitrogen hydrolase family protein [Candidatus Levybacteria bacterium]|nr:carbon-nitrogen hydrolase family protein [Candidatus Levybacteria bacterium]MBI2420503.1 carbon-nitrogen hydrolase family protein [Candidatus Levybacteria bacterium]